jgi:hypothetical protein
MAKQPPFFHIIGKTPQEIENARTVAEWLKYAATTANKVDSTVNGLSAIKGKVKVNKNDTTPEYLEDKIVEGSDIDFVQSNDGRGAKEIKANFKLAVSTSEPTTITEGMLWFDSDARFGTPFTIGDGEAGIDYELKFDGETNDGSIFWMEDEDKFQIADDVLLDETLTVAGATTLGALSATSYNFVSYDGDILTHAGEVLTYA